MTLSATEWRKVRRIVREKLGYEELRPGQQQALEAVLSGRDALAILPTGSGKSAIYQIAALLVEGPTVVVSPLIALQRDQAESIEQNQLGEARVVNSLMTASEREDAFASLEEQSFEFLMLSPEQLANADTFERVRRAAPSLFVVDEAHCISEWGHDFRPDYLRLGAIVDALGHPRTIALTATANPEVRDEIIARLHLRDPEVIVAGFDRPNIHLSVRRVTGERLKREMMIEQVLAANKPGIVYAATRRHVEDLARALAARGVSAAAYHAGLKRDERNTRQSAFMAGEVQVMVATNAFGMGIDKPDVRFVFHFDAPESLDEYYQEVGRAGRDGNPAQATLFYSHRDLNLRRFMASGGKLSRDEVDRVLSALERTRAPTLPKALAREVGLSRAKVARALARLEEHAMVKSLPTGAVIGLGKKFDLDAVAEGAVENQEQRREAQQRRVELVRIWAELDSCRRAFLLKHFGEPFERPCNNCDNCNQPRRASRVSKAPSHPVEQQAQPTAQNPFSAGTRVVHKKWGEGIVVGFDDDAQRHLVVRFDDAGERRLATELLRRTKLLEARSEKTRERRGQRVKSSLDVR